MDKFEKRLEQLDHMDETERDRALQNDKKACICPDCGSYNDCAKVDDELMYCLTGKSIKCIFDEVECICPDCPLTEKMGQDKIYYCTRGSERSQREK